MSTGADDQVLGVATAPDGSILHLENYGASQIRVGGFDSFGNALWTKTYPGRLGDGSIAATSTGGLLLWAGTNPDLPVDLGTGPKQRAFLAQLGPHGELIRYLDDCTNYNDTCIIDSAREAPNGDVIEWTEFDKGSDVGVIHRDGRYQSIQPGFIWTGAIGVTSDNDILIGGWVHFAGSCGSESLTPGDGLLMKVGSDGTCLWAYSLPQHTGVSAIGVTAIGTVVATVNDWNGAVTLHVLEKDGTFRWSKSVDGDILAVDPAGRAALTPHLSGTCPSSTHVTYYDLAGDLVFTRSIAWSGCMSAPPFSLTTLPNHDIVLGGTFQGSADFGEGSVTSEGADGLILDLMP